MSDLVVRVGGEQWVIDSIDDLTLVISPPIKLDKAYLQIDNEFIALTEHGVVRAKPPLEPWIADVRFV